MIVSVYDTKPYDREHFLRAPGQEKLLFRFHDFRLSAATAASAADAQAVCIFVNDTGDRPCLENLKASGVRDIALRCAGYNNIDLESARKLGFVVHRVPAYSPYAVAEHAIALLLALNRKIHRAFNRVREHNFSLAGLVGFDLHGKTAGIVGTGKIGRIAGQILRGFGCDMLAYDPFPSEQWAKQHVVRYVDLNTLLAESHIVSLHLPLIPDTHHLINAERIQRMRPGAYLINTSRGKIVETAALIDALKSGRLGGVALDVYEEEEGIFFEDLSDKVLLDDELTRLLTFPNVLVTSHQAFLTHEALSEIARVTIENLLRFSRGDPLLDGTAL
jgi:D-lactate dehydrogenase